MVPPRVDYALTPLGRTLREIIEALLEWAEAHTANIDRARATYDRRRAAGRDAARGPRASVERIS